MKIVLRIVLFYLLLPVMLWGQMVVDTSFLRIEENFLSQLEVYPQEKIHLHTDRDFYVPGEKIWFKAYLVDALTHQFPTYSRYVYAELIDSRDSLVSRVMIHPENNLFQGHIFLSEIIPEGNYTLRAYTQYMENLGDDYFFKKIIRIGTLSSTQSQKSPTSQKSQLPPRTTKSTPADFDVTFFPEGGTPVEGVFCKIAFKAINKNGSSETISGELVDENQTTITSIETFHAGMGVFTFIPMPGKRYYLKCRNGNGLEKLFELPQADPRAYALTTLQRNKMLMVGVRKSESRPNIPLYLLAHNRGMVFYFAAWDNTNESVSFPEESLPAGVLQFILFDEQMNPLSERLVFSKNYDPGKVDFQTGKALYEKREKVIATLTPSPSGRAGEGLFLSVAITDDSDIAVDSTTTILSSLLLSSELKGYIENPAWYLQDNPESVTALDYLMMTHGWRRYNIPEVVKGNPEYPSIPFQESQQITGKVHTLALSKPVTGSEIIITMKDGDFGLTSSDENGAFILKDFEYPDSTTYFIQALSKSGSSSVELFLDGEIFPEPIHAPQSPVKDIPVIQNELKPSPFIEKAELRAKYDEDIRVINLSEVEVTALRIDRNKEEPRLQFWGNLNADVTIRREEIEKRAPRLVSEMLQTIPGVRVSPNGVIIIRNSKDPPLVLIDGMPFAWPDKMQSPYQSPLETVNVHDVESIDVTKGADATAFGVRGANGVISITTRRGIDVIREVEKYRESQALNSIIYTPLGYQKPVEFYSPKYETLDVKYLSIPDYRTTIFWKPDIVISDETGETSFEFYTSDFPTTYSVVIEGLTTDGRIIRQVEKIKVE